MEMSRATFDEQVLPHLDALYRFARHLSGNSIDAEDLVQATMLRSLRAWERLEPVSNVRACLMTILRHQFFNESRKKRIVIDLGDDPEPALAAVPRGDAPGSARASLPADCALNSAEHEGSDGARPGRRRPAGVGHRA